MVLNSEGNSYDNNALMTYTNGIHWDKKLFRQEIKVQIAWLQILIESAVIDEGQASEIKNRLLGIEDDMETDTFDWQIGNEDIHMNIERAVTETHGLLGKTIHTGRSRNDLVATTLRLHVADSVDQLSTDLTTLGRGLTKLAESNKHITIPGTTHLQHGQPILLAQVLLGHAWPHTRTIKTLENTKSLALTAMPLGAGAFNGTTLIGNFEQMAKGLGFENPCLNGYDAVSDRDFMLTFLNAVSLHAVHLGRLCEDLIYWAASPIKLLKLPHQWSTGSSIMPQKRNPDIAEITRAKTSRLIQQSSCAAQLVASLGTSYYSDLHELKKIYLETLEMVQEIHSVFIPFVGDLEFNADAAAKLLNCGHILATDYANQLVDSGTPFREAYKQTAMLVADAEEKNIQIHELETVNIEYSASISQRVSPGGTSIEQINLQISKLLTVLDGKNQ